MIDSHTIDLITFLFDIFYIFFNNLYILYYRIYITCISCITGGVQAPAGVDCRWGFDRQCR